jgi:hypothetical protein
VHNFESIVERALTVTIRIQNDPPRLLTYVSDLDGMVAEHTDIGPTAQVLESLGTVLPDGFDG